MFTASAKSQDLSITWNHRKFMSNQNCDGPAFNTMVKRFVFAVNIGKYILTSANVQPALVESFLKDVMTGMHHANLDTLAAPRGGTDDVRGARERKVGADGVMVASHDNFERMRLCSQPSIELGGCLGAWPVRHVDLTREAATSGC